jgi:hypothetical protein
MMEHDTDDVLDQLREELGRVSVAPEFAARVQQRIAAGAEQSVDLLAEELGAMAVSPEFKVRVRQQVDAAQHARAGSWLRGWRWLAPVAAAAGVAIVAAMIWRGSNDVPAPVTTAAIAAKPTPEMAHDIARPSQPTVEVPRPARTAPAARTVAAAAESSTLEPSLEVITNQPAILRAMYARIAADATVVETTTIPLSDTAPEIVVPLIEVSPIVVKSLIDLPAVGGAQPIIRRVTADTAERSQK